MGGELDGPISNFPDLPAILHMNNSKFSTGVCKVFENTSKAEKTNATGADDGGYRSLDFVGDESADVMYTHLKIL